MINDQLGADVFSTDTESRDWITSSTRTRSLRAGSTRACLLSARNFDLDTLSSRYTQHSRCARDKFARDNGRPFPGEKFSYGRRLSGISVVKIIVRQSVKNVTRTRHAALRRDTDLRVCCAFLKEPATLLIANEGILGRDKTGRNRGRKSNSDVCPVCLSGLLE